MSARSCVALFTLLVPSAASGAEFGVYGTTLAQLWKQELPGFDKNTFAPATQFLGIDATQMADGNLSMHLFGWGRVNLADQDFSTGKGGGELSSGFLRYRFSKANAELKLGRFASTDGIATEQVDGLAGRADLRGGLAFSFFAGKPVIYKTLPAAEQTEYEKQRNFIGGGRLSLRVPRVLELGISYVQDGKAPVPDPLLPSPIDYSRRFLGGDIRIAPHPSFELSGRTMYNTAPRAEATATSGDSRLAEHDYTLNLKFSKLISLSGNFTERNFKEYFAGTNLPSLFRQVENDKHRGLGGSLTVGDNQAFSLVADYRKTRRETYGDASRFGGEVRWGSSALKLQSGAGYHRVTAADVLLVGAQIPFYGLSHHEVRIWLLHDGGTYAVSLDGIQHRYDDKNNPNLNGRTSVYEFVASLGYRPTSTLNISGDVSYGADPQFQKEVRGLLRVEFRFGLGGQGGGK